MKQINIGSKYNVPFKIRINFWLKYNEELTAVLLDRENSIYYNYRFN